MRKVSVALFVGLVLAVAAVGSVVAEDADGNALYDKKCALCHGKDGVAKKMAEGSANFNDAAWQEKTSAETIAKSTAEGIPDSKMKGYGEKLSEAEIKAIAAYIKTLK